MPLSEDEQRILREIEQRYYTHDKRSAERIGHTTLPRYLGRNCAWSAAGFALGLVVLLVSFAFSWLLAIFGFLLMVGSATWFAQNLRRMGRHGWQQLTRAAQASNLNERIAEARRRLRGQPGEGG